jgi:hypothetical protein
VGEAKLDFVDISLDTNHFELRWREQARVSASLLQHRAHIPFEQVAEASLCWHLQRLFFRLDMIGAKTLPQSRRDYFKAEAKKQQRPQ